MSRWPLKLITRQPDGWVLTVMYLWAGAGASNINAKDNTAIGAGALNKQSFNNNGTAWSSDNIAIDTDALFNNQPTTAASSGSQNVAIGNYSLYSNKTGYYNTAEGYNSLLSNTSGFSNTAVGYFALSSNTTANNNTAIGSGALYSNTSGFSNTAGGYHALYSNNNANFNTAFGYSSLFSNSTGTSNTAIGYNALSINGTGSSNTAIGSEALASNIGGKNLTAIGYGADVNNDLLSNATAIGYNTSVAASNTVVVGNNSITSIGGQVGWTNFSDGRVKNNVQENVVGLNFIKSLSRLLFIMMLRKKRPCLARNIRKILKGNTTSRK